MVAGEVPGDYAGPEAPGRVQTAAGIEDSDQFGDKQCKADTDRGEEGGFVLFGCEHEDGDDEHRGEEHLHEDALGDGHVVAQGCRDVQFTREHGRDDTRSTNASEHL